VGVWVGMHVCVGVCVGGVGVGVWWKEVHTCMHVHCVSCIGQSFTCINRGQKWNLVKIWGEQHVHCVNWYTEPKIPKGGEGGW